MLSKGKQIGHLPPDSEFDRLLVDFETATLDFFNLDNTLRYVLPLSSIPLLRTLLIK